MCSGKIKGRYRSKIIEGRNENRSDMELIQGFVKRERDSWVRRNNQTDNGRKLPQMIERFKIFR